MFEGSIPFTRSTFVLFQKTVLLSCSRSLECLLDERLGF